MKVEKTLKDIKNPGHLSEDENFVSFSMEVLQQSCKALELTTIILN
jgi:hypothetical protein